MPLEPLRPRRRSSVDFVQRRPCCRGKLADAFRELTDLDGMTFQKAGVTIGVLRGVTQCEEGCLRGPKRCIDASSCMLYRLWPFYRHIGPSSLRQSQLVMGLLQPAIDLHRISSLTYERTPGHLQGVPRLIGGSKEGAVRLTAHLPTPASVLGSRLCPHLLTR